MMVLMLVLMLVLMQVLMLVLMGLPYDVVPVSTNMMFELVCVLFGNPVPTKQGRRSLWLGMLMGDVPSMGRHWAETGVLVG